MSADREMTLAEVGDYSEDEEAPQRISRNPRPATGKKSWTHTKREGKTATKWNVTTRFDHTRVPEPIRQMTYSKLGKKDRAIPTRLEKLRGKTPTVAYDAAVNDLINIILNAKKDITRVEGLDDYVNAKKYADKRGYRISGEDADINHDGVNDIVLYDRKGKPVIVNGYKLSPSKQPLRKLYQKAKRTGTLDDPDAGYRGYVRQLYGAGEWNEEGVREVAHDKNNLPAELKELKLRGWQIPTAPKKEKGIHQKIMDIIKNEFDNFINVNCDERTWVKGALPRFKIFTLMYLIAIEKELWNTLDANNKQKILEDVEAINAMQEGVEGDDVTIYDAFKAFKDSNKKQVNEFMKSNWQGIVTIDFEPIIMEILDSIGFTAEIIATLPTDEQIKRELSDDELEEFKTNKKRLSEAWKKQADNLKEAKIAEIFAV